MNIIELIKEERNNISMRFFHGGNLDEIKQNYSQNSGRYEFCAGLYLVNDYRIASKYAKGSRKLYTVEVNYGNNLDDNFIEYKNCISFIKNYIISRHRNTLISIIDKKTVDGKVPAYLINNLILNYKAISSSKTNELKNFLIENGIDYDISFNSFGSGEYMMILYNTNIIKKITRIDRSKLDIFKFNDIYK